MSRNTLAKGHKQLEDSKKEFAERLKEVNAQIAESYQKLQVNTEKLMNDQRRQRIQVMTDCMRIASDHLAPKLKRESMQQRAAMIKELADYLHEHVWEPAFTVEDFAYPQLEMTVAQE